MGREVRRVPANWEHPKRRNGEYIPLNDGFNKALTEWEMESKLFSQGLQSVFNKPGATEPLPGSAMGKTFEEWYGEKPEQKDYMPDWPEEERTHLQMYEDTTEGTPISPAMETPEELAQWLVDNKASAFGNLTAGYDQWMSTIMRGWACSAVMSSQGLESGVAAFHEYNKE